MPLDQFASKLALGTVQLGIPYGINNKLGVPDDLELNKIFDTAYTAGIYVLDSAPGYGNAEERVGKFSQNRFQIISKFSNCFDQRSFIDSVHQSVNRLCVQSLYGLLAHDANNLISYPELWEFLSLEKENKVIRKIGYSIYTTEQLDKLLALGMIPDIIQIPYNLFDRKFETYFKELKELGTEIHIRSVFLQGLFFIKPDELPEKLIPLKKGLATIQNICAEENISVNQLAISFAAQNPFVDKIVIGVDAASQLSQNIKDIEQNAVTANTIQKIKQIKIVDESLLSPVNWK